MSTDFWFSELCLALNLDHTTLDDNLILNEKTHPNASDIIEKTAVGITNSIFRKGLDENLYTVPIKSQLQFIVNEKLRRLKNYRYGGIPQTPINTAIIQVICGTNKYDLPKVSGENKVILYDLVEYDHAKRRWVKSKENNRIRIPLYDTTDMELSEVLFSPETVDHIFYSDIEFYIPKGLSHDYMDKTRIVTTLVDVTEEKSESGGTFWKAESVPFVPYTGAISYISLKKWVKSYIPISSIKNLIQPEIQSEILKNYPLLSDEISECKDGVVVPLSMLSAPNSVVKKLAFNLVLPYHSNQLKSSQWGDILSRLKDLSSGSGNILILDVEKVFAEDVMYLELYQIKHVHYKNMVYNVDWESVKVKGPIGSRQHIVKLVLPVPQQKIGARVGTPSRSFLNESDKPETVFVVWDPNAEEWVKDNEETDELFKERRALKEDYVDVPFLLFWHNSPQMPKWCDYGASPRTIVRRPIFQKSLPHCLGIITFSNYMTEWLNKNLPEVPVFDKNGKLKEKKTRKVDTLCLKYPSVNPTSEKFDFEAFMKNEEKFLIQIGYKIKRLCFIGNIKTKTYGKLWIYDNDRALELLQKERFEHCICEESCSNMEDVVITKMDHKIYENLLKNNILVSNVYDANICIDVIDAITYHTPILINFHPAVVEYLGKNYPLYYRSEEEARLKAHNNDLIKAAHIYLKNSNFDKLYTYNSFITSFQNSDLIKNLNKKYNKFKPADEWEHPNTLTIPPSPRVKLNVNSVAKEVKQKEKEKEIENKLNFLGAPEKKNVELESPTYHLKQHPPTPNSFRVPPSPRTPSSLMHKPLEPYTPRSPNINKTNT